MGQIIGKHMKCAETKLNGRIHSSWSPNAFSSISERSGVFSRYEGVNGAVDWKFTCPNLVAGSLWEKKKPNVINNNCKRFAMGIRHLNLLYVYRPKWVINLKRQQWTSDLHLHLYSVAFVCIENACTNCPIRRSFDRSIDRLNEEKREKGKLELSQLAHAAFSVHTFSFVCVFFPH